MLKLLEAREELVGYFSFSQFSHFLHLSVRPTVDTSYNQVKELDFELVAPSLLQHKVITPTEYGALSRLPGEEQARWCRWYNNMPTLGSWNA